MLGDDLVALLREHRKQQAEDRLVAGPALIDSGAVFVEVNGRSLHPNKASTTFSRAASAAELPTRSDQGVRLGHAKPSITLAVCSFPQVLRQATSEVLFEARQALTHEHGEDDTGRTAVCTSGRQVAW